MPATADGAEATSETRPWRHVGRRVSGSRVRLLTQPTSGRPGTGAIDGPSSPMRRARTLPGRCARVSATVLRRVEKPGTEAIAVATYGRMVWEKRFVICSLSAITSTLPITAGHLLALQKLFVKST